MKARYYEDIEKFYDLVFPFLLKKEIENGLILSILNSLKQDIHKYRQEKPILLTITQENEIKLIVLRIPPHDLLISYTNDLDSIEILAESLL